MLASPQPTKRWPIAPASSWGQSSGKRFRQRFALVNQKSNSAQTYVCCHSGVVVGFYSLAVGSVHPATAALLVHAKDETARQWYLNWEFEPSPSDPFHLFLLVKDLKAMTHPKHG